MYSVWSCSSPNSPYTDHEWETLPHVFLTAEPEWDPTVLGARPRPSYYGITPGEVDSSLVSSSPFDEFGHYRHRVVVQYATYFASRDNDHDIEDVIDQCVFHSQRPWDGDLVSLSTLSMNITLLMIMVIIPQLLFLMTLLLFQ